MTSNAEDFMINGGLGIEKKIPRLNEFIAGSENIVFFGGAGVSTESGIPDFRSAGGLYGDKSQKIPPEQILSHTYFYRNTGNFFDYYRKNILHTDAEPNRAHIKLAELENAGKLKAVITQNIDGLHQKAGSKNVIELHGSVYRNYCVKCKKAYDIKYIIESRGVPVCDCLGVVRPDVVLYEESLDTAVMRNAVESIGAADVLIVGGTSLVVYPAAGLLRYYGGDKLVIINMSETGDDGRAALVIRGPIGEVMGAVDIYMAGQCP